MTPRRRITAALIGLLLLVGGTWVGQQLLSPPGEPSSAVVMSDLPVRPLPELPVQVADTWHLIERDGPFHDRQDNEVFEITGRVGELYYTADHYSSFVRVDSDR